MTAASTGSHADVACLPCPCILTWHAFHVWQVRALRADGARAAHEVIVPNNCTASFVRSHGSHRAGTRHCTPHSALTACRALCVPQVKIKASGLCTPHFGSVRSLLDAQPDASYALLHEPRSGRHGHPPLLAWRRLPYLRGAAYLIW